MVSTPELVHRLYVEFVPEMKLIFFPGMSLLTLTLTLTNQESKTLPNIMKRKINTIHLNKTKSKTLLFTPLHHVTLRWQQCDREFRVNTPRTIEQEEIIQVHNEKIHNRFG